MYVETIILQLARLLKERAESFIKYIFSMRDFIKNQVRHHKKVCSIVQWQKNRAVARNIARWLKCGEEERTRQKKRRSPKTLSFGQTTNREF